MPITVEICEAGYVVRTNLADPWDVNELIAAAGPGRTHRDSVTHKVHSLIDLTHAVIVPQGVLRARFTSGFSHQNSGQMAVIGATAFARGLIELMGQLTHSEKITYFDTEAEALTYLRALIAREQADQTPGELSKSA